LQILWRSAFTRSPLLQQLRCTCRRQTQPG
jgi:isochorismate hydrolase